MFPVGNRKQGFESCPRAFTALGPPGQAIAVTVAAVTPGVVSTILGISQAAMNRQTGDDPTMLARNYLTVECDVDLAVIFAATIAAVTGANAPVIATVGTLNASGVYTAVTGVGFVLYAKQPRRFLLQQGVDLFMGFVAAGAGVLRVYQSSPDNA